MKDIDIIIEIDGHTINVNTDMIEEDEEVETIEEMIEEPQETINVPKTMAEFKKAIENKDEKAVDKALETFAKNYKKEMKAIRLISGRFHKI